MTCKILLFFDEAWFHLFHLVSSQNYETWSASYPHNNITDLFNKTIKVQKYQNPLNHISLC
jgi:hypothetical protein